MHPSACNAVIRHSAFILFCSGQHRSQGYTGASLRFGLVPGASLHTLHSVVIVALASFLGRYSCLCSQLTSFRPPAAHYQSPRWAFPGRLHSDSHCFADNCFLTCASFPAGGSFLHPVQNFFAFRSWTVFTARFTSVTKTSTYFGVQRLWFECWHVWPLDFKIGLQANRQRWFKCMGHFRAEGCAEAIAPELGGWGFD